MINVDTVYQRVLAILNKEQRGFLTPQKFNLFANQVQLDILEQYFYDLETFLMIPGNSTVHADQVNILETKIAKFETTKSLTYSAPYFLIPNNTYRISSVVWDGKDAERVDRKTLKYIRKSPLAAPTNDFPVFIESEAGLRIFGGSELDSADLPLLELDCIDIPAPVNWAYVSVLGKPQYNAGPSVHFELDPSEETDVTLAILKLAGVEVKAADIYNFTVAEENQEQQQENR